MIGVIEALQKNQDVMAVASICLFMVCAAAVISIYNITEALAVRWRRK